MHPILLRWRGVSIYSYSVLMYLGILSGIAYAQWQGRRAGYRNWQVIDGALWALLGGLIGARAMYVLLNWVDYAGHAAALLRFWGGGLVFQGGLLGGLVALWLYSLYARLSFVRLADLAAPAVSLAQGIGWAGALLHGANYGLIMRSPFSMWLPDLYGVYGPRFPTQLVASLFGFLLFLFLHRLSGRAFLRLRIAELKQPGTLALLYLFGSGLGHLALEFTRADEASYVGMLRVTQWIELAEVVGACALLLYLWRRRAPMRRG